MKVTGKEEVLIGAPVKPDLETGVERRRHLPYLSTPKDPQSCPISSLREMLAVTCHLALTDASLTQ